MSTDYAEQLFKSIDTIIAARLGELAFDQTVVCTITDDSEKETGKYSVSNGSMGFDAFSDNKTYNKDEQVLVMVPNGDWSQQKTIINRYITNIDAITYHSPTQGIGNLTGNLVRSKADVMGLAASGMKEYNAGSTTYDIPWLIEIGSVEGKSYNTEIFTNLCIKTCVKSLLGNYRFSSGVYGIRVVFNQGEDDIICDFNSSQDMFGSVYDFVDWVHQEQSFAIPKSISTIKNIHIYFYQDQNFIYKDEEDNDIQLVPSHVGGGNFFSNIFIKDVEVYLGYRTDQMGATIYTDQAIDYKPGNMKRKVSLLWTEKDDKDNPIALFESTNEGQLKLKDGYRIQWFIDSEDGTLQQVSSFDNNDSIEFNCLSSLSFTQVQAKILKGQENTSDFIIYESNILRFENSVDKTGTTPRSDILLRIVNKENALDSYPYYDFNNKIINTRKDENGNIINEAGVVRTLGIQWCSTKSNIDNSFWEGAEFNWICPNKSTQIIGVEITEEDKKDAEFIQHEIWHDIPKCVFKYKIKPEYLDSNKNNTIICEIELDGKIAYQGQRNLRAEKTLIFSTHPTDSDGNEVAPNKNIWNVVDEVIGTPTNPEPGTVYDHLTTKIDALSEDFRPEKFVLNAWDTSNPDEEFGIYINSHAEDDNQNSVPYFRVGKGKKDNSNAPLYGENLIEVSKNRFLIASTEFVLDAWDSNQGIYLNSTPKWYANHEEVSSDTEGAQQDFYFSIGKENNWIQFNDQYGLRMDVSNFILHAFQDEKTEKDEFLKAHGIYFNSNPEDNGYWFIIGETDENHNGGKNNFIQMDKGGKFTIQTNDKFVLNAWDETNGGLYIDSKPVNMPYIRMGKLEDDYLEYGKDGLIVKGSIEADKGYFGPWNISGNALSISETDENTAVTIYINRPSDLNAPWHQGGVFDNNFNQFSTTGDFIYMEHQQSCSLRITADGSLYAKNTYLENLTIHEGLTIYHDYEDEDGNKESTNLDGLGLSVTSGTWLEVPEVEVPSASFTEILNTVDWWRDVVEEAELVFGNNIHFAGTIYFDDIASAWFTSDAEIKLPGYDKNVLDANSNGDLRLRLYHGDYGPMRLCWRYKGKNNLSGKDEYYLCGDI